MRSLIPHSGTDFQYNCVTSSLTDFTDCCRVGRRAVCPHCLKPNRQLETEEGNFARSRDEGTSDGSSFTLLNVRVYCFFASSSSLCAAASPSSAVCPATSLSLQHYLEESVRELYGGIIKFARRNEGRQGEVDGRRTPATTVFARLWAGRGRRRFACQLANPTTPHGPLGWGALPKHSDEYHPRSASLHT